jgi:hypothetical protein
MTTNETSAAADDNDTAAMQRAIDYVRALSPAHAERVDREIAEEGFQKAAWGAAYTAQMHTMGLPPWCFPPCWADPPWLGGVEGLLKNGDPDRQASARLLLKMREHGVSQFEPDPLAALRTKRRKKNPAR